MVRKSGDRNPKTRPTFEEIFARFSKINSSALEGERACNYSFAPLAFDNSCIQYLTHEIADRPDLALDPGLHLCVFRHLYRIRCSPCIRSSLQRNSGKDRIYAAVPPSLSLPFSMSRTSCLKLSIQRRHISCACGHYPRTRCTENPGSYANQEGECASCNERSQTPSIQCRARLRPSLWVL